MAINILIALDDDVVARLDELVSDNKSINLFAADSPESNEWNRIFRSKGRVLADEYLRVFVRKHRQQYPRSRSAMAAQMVTQAIMQAIAQRKQQPAKAKRRAQPSNGGVQPLENTT